MSVQVEVLFDRIPAAAAALEAAVKRGIEEAGQMAAESAKRRAPVVTGTLRDSIEASDGEVTASAPYAQFVEYGTYKDPTQPFMRPAYEEVAPKLLAEMKGIGRVL